MTNVIVSALLNIPRDSGSRQQIWTAGSAVVDIAIAVTMTILVCLLLLPPADGRLNTTQMLKRKTGIRKTDMMVNKIIRLVVETGSLTGRISAHYVHMLLNPRAASVAIVALALATAFPVCVASAVLGTTLIPHG